jgi:ABC-type glycerol-3-phosphate transport system permease component
MTNAKTSSLTGLKQRRIIGKVAFYVLGLLVAVIVCIPFYWMIITSLKGRGAIMSIPVEWIPKEPTLDAYKKLFAMPEFVGSIFNSFYVSVLCTAVRLLCAAMAAFALTKIPFKGRNAVFGIYVTALMIPSQITFIPHVHKCKDSQRCNSAAAHGQYDFEKNAPHARAINNSSFNIGIVDRHHFLPHHKNGKGIKQLQQHKRI